MEVLRLQLNTLGWMPRRARNGVGVNPGPATPSIITAHHRTRALSTSCPKGWGQTWGGFRGATQSPAELPTLPKMAMRQLP